jgi:hypothetical protein
MLVALMGRVSLEKERWEVLMKPQQVATKGG